jgi:hypothetical protein
MPKVNHPEPTELENHALTLVNNNVAGLLRNMTVEEFKALRALVHEGRLYLHNDVATFFIRVGEWEGDEEKRGHLHNWSGYW